jgi:putative ATPase
MTNLFHAAGMEEEAPRPLADRLRPKTLAEVVGQDHLVGPDGTLTRMLKSGRLQSMILWGPPGSGKTTVARLLADATRLEFEQLSAIFSGVQDLRKAFDRAKGRRQTGKGTLLFIDEIHRFNRAHHREPVVRAQRRPALARRGADLPSPRRGGAGEAAGPRRGHGGPCAAARC